MSTQSNEFLSPHCSAVPSREDANRAVSILLSYLKNNDFCEVIVTDNGGVAYRKTHIHEELFAAYQRADAAGYLSDRVAELFTGLRELRRWVGDGDLSESFGWDDSAYTPEYRAVLHATDALLKPNS